MRATQGFFNTSIDYLERLPYVERYSLFGAFRSDVSNIGLNGAMLSSGGQLTDIGMWYLGRRGLGVAPSQGQEQTRKGKSFMNQNQATLVNGQVAVVGLYVAVLLLITDTMPGWLVW